MVNVKVRLLMTVAVQAMIVIDRLCYEWLEGILYCKDNMNGDSDVQQGW